MNLNSFELNIQPRGDIGTKDARRLRAAGNIPVTIYGKGVLKSGFVNVLELQKALNSGDLFAQFTNLNCEGKKYLVFAKVMQKHSVSGKILHLDFQVVEKNEEVEMFVPVKFTEKEICEPLKLGGILNVICDKVLLKAKPADIPNCVEYSLKDIQGNASIAISELKIPKNCQISKAFHYKMLASILAARKKAAEVSSVK